VADIVDFRPWFRVYEAVWVFGKSDRIWVVVVSAYIKCHGN